MPHCPPPSSSQLNRSRVPGQLRNFLQNSQGRQWEGDFRDYLRERHSLLNPNKNAFCLPDDNSGKEYSDLSSAIREAELRNDEVIMTRWAPDEGFESKPLGDFRIDVNPSDHAVRICVRDHECEDGDRVRVTVDAETVFSGEITSEWSCRDVPINEGNNRIELRAINGSERKGNCSYADANTGEIRVEGRNAGTQTWKHRGGAGSSASTIVTVRSTVPGRDRYGPQDQLPGGSARAVEPRVRLARRHALGPPAC